MEADQNKDSKIPKSNPSKAMDSKHEVEQSNDAKTTQDFPGYPHYPSKENKMGERTDLHSEERNLEIATSGSNEMGVGQRFDKKENKLEHEQNDELSVLNSRDEEIGIPQNVSNEDVNKNLPGSNLEKDADENR